VNVCLVEEGTGHSAVWKPSSTPGDCFRSIAGGVSENIAAIGRCPSDIAFFGDVTAAPCNALPKNF